jgi:uncharacterized membrane protein
VTFFAVAFICAFFASLSQRDRDMNEYRSLCNVLSVGFVFLASEAWALSFRGSEYLWLVELLVNLFWVAIGYIVYLYRNRDNEATSARIEEVKEPFL